MPPFVRRPTPLLSFYENKQKGSAPAVVLFSAHPFSRPPFFLGGGGWFVFPPWLLLPGDGSLQSGSVSVGFRLEPDSVRASSSAKPPLFKEKQNKNEQKKPRAGEFPHPLLPPRVQKLLRSTHPETPIYHLVGSGIVFNHQNLKIIIIASDAAIKTSGQRHNER